MVLSKNDFCGVQLRSTGAEYQNIPWSDAGTFLIQILQFVSRQLGGGYFPAEYNCGVVSAE